MPVTAKLSRRFYERLGDEIANDLVDWFNMVDSAYRSDLKDLNEVNFARFDAKLEQRVVELDAKIERLVAQLEARLEQKIAQLDAKLERRVAELRAEMQAGFVAADARLAQRLAELEARLTKRMFRFWVVQSATTVGLVFGVVKLLGV